jgi:hypothetical protein
MFVIVLNKLHVTLVANVDVMMMSSHRQRMKYIFELIIFSSNDRITYAIIM